MSEDREEIYDFSDADDFIKNVKEIDMTFKDHRADDDFERMLAELNGKVNPKPEASAEPDIEPEDDSIAAALAARSAAKRAAEEQARRDAEERAKREAEEKARHPVGCHDIGIGNLVVELALLSVDAGDLGVNAFHLGADALALLGEGGIGTANLVARSL